MTYQLYWHNIVKNRIYLQARHDGRNAAKIEHMLLSQKITAKIQQNKIINHDFHLFRNFPPLHKSKSLIGYCVAFAAFNSQ